MAVIAANVTEETVDLIQQVLATPELLRFAQQNKLNLSDNTTLIRLAILNLIKNLPSKDEVNILKSALLRPHEFDDFLKQKLGIVENDI